MNSNMKLRIIFLVALAAFSVLAFGQSATSKDVKTKYRTFAYGGLAVGNTENSDPVDSLTIVDGSLRAYKNGVQLNTPDRSGITFDTTGTLTNTNRLAITTRYDFKTEFSGDPVAKALNAWTSSNDIVLAPMCALNFQAGSGFTSGTINFTALDPVTDTTYCPNVKFIMSTPGSYTDAGYNGIGLYKLVGSNMIRVAETGDVSGLYTSIYNVVALTTPYTALPGELLFTGVLHMQSAQPTPAVMVDVSILTNNYSQYFLDNTGNLKISCSLAGQTSMPATVALSSTTRTVYMKGVFVCK